MRPVFWGVLYWRHFFPILLCQHHRLKLINHLCIGHVGYERVELVPARLFALDTGVVKGGKLTCIVFPGCELFSVKSERNYYVESFNEWHLNEEAAQTDPRQWPLRKVIDFSNSPVAVLHADYQDRPTN